ncbi:MULTISPECIES: metal ABC transporter solute-binding protein, Zn/Mn family [Roseomonadaceae]|uniref:Zinc ABC transporter substrate-binding protein n=1 Tax=Falsiroseomonas oleicola TaxID=2801474 RepID=A0ABS6H3D8_9PROT|nr:zinc ABC transporter substrate-binding protein [Roseomonas oleicola]MBU8543187.1 zinc ABC transporter substrate-binding protein [Roseomonas oleicola]
MRRRSLLALPALLLPGLAAAQGAPQAPLVVASFSILGDMVAQIAGDRVRLRAIAGPNVDAHSFSPRPSDAQALRGAALVVRNGLGFDGWMDRMLRAAGYRGAVATTTQGITPRMMDSDGHDHGHGHSHGGGGRRHSHSVGPRQVPDPHAWQDLRFGIQYARTIGAALEAALPAQAAAIREGTAAYVARLEALDGWVRAEIAAVPEARRKVVTSHDAFGYFGAAYGVTFLAPQGISTEAEPSAADVARLIRQIRAEGITAVFLENMGNPATLTRLAEEAGVRVRGRLFADALSLPDGPAPTYEGMFRHNVGLLVPAMRGAA